jgi:hypothetical protein
MLAGRFKRCKHAIAMSTKIVDLSRPAHLPLTSPGRLSHKRKLVRSSSRMYADGLKHARLRVIGEIKAATDGL